MIPKKTVFVLGAGAHCPYGFPDGGKLIRDMVDTLPSAEANENGFVKCAWQLGGQVHGGLRRGLVELRKALEFSGHQSIDSFLRTHRDNSLFVDVGRWLIAWLLLPHEFRFRFSRLEGKPGRTDDQDWMSYLFSRMLKGCINSPEEFLEKNNVGFATFNYDRTLEYFLTWKLYNSFPHLTMTDAWGLAQRIPIVHVYGSLGPFDPTQTQRLGSLHSSIVAARSGSVRLMYDERTNETTLEQQLKNLFADAHKVVFLGFGFDPDNIHALKLKELLKNIPTQGVMASRYNVPEGEWQTMQNDMAPIQIDDHSRSDRIVSRDWDALQFLRESRSLE
jgi:hypothetical protein